MPALGDRGEEEREENIQLRVEMKRIPIKTARDIAQRFEYDQVLIWAWNKKDGQHVTTYGRSMQDCDQIAQGGNYIKRHMLNWPDNKCCAEPHRVKQLKAEIKKLRQDKQD